MRNDMKMMKIRLESPVKILDHAFGLHVCRVTSKPWLHEFTNFP